MEEDDKLKEEFKRIHKKSKRINLEKVSLVYNSIKDKQSKTKQPSTILEISNDTKLKKATVRTYIKHLEENKYIKKNRQYTPPFLKVTTKKGDVEFIYGKDNRDSRIKDEVRSLLNEFTNLSEKNQKEIEEEIKIAKNSKDYNSKFFISYNKSIDWFWKNNFGKDLVKLEIGSGANKYLIS